MDVHPLYLGQLRPTAGLHYFRRAGLLHFDDCRTIRVTADTAGRRASLPGGWLPRAAGDLYCDGIVYRCRTIALQAAVHVAGTDRGADWDPRLFRGVENFGSIRTRRISLAAKEKVNGWQICCQPSR